MSRRKLAAADKGVIAVAIRELMKPALSSVRA
jgi:hypothetical protein